MNQYPTEFEPFSFNLNCVKCGYDKALRKYREVEYINASPLGGPSYKIRGEGPDHDWIQRQCRDCGYEWAEYCLDWEPDE